MSQTLALVPLSSSLKRRASRFPSPPREKRACVQHRLSGTKRTCSSRADDPIEERRSLVAPALRVREEEKEEDEEKEIRQAHVQLPCHDLHFRGRCKRKRPDEEEGNFSGRPKRPCGTEGDGSETALQQERVCAAFVTLGQLMCTWLAASWTRYARLSSQRSCRAQAASALESREYDGDGDGGGGGCVE